MKRSFTIMNECILKNSKLSWPLKKILIFINYSNFKGDHYLSKNFIAEKSMVGKRTISGHLRSLRKNGYIEVSYQPGKPSIFKITEKIFIDFAKGDI